MATNDTDPQRTQPFADDASRTEPGAPPDVDVDDASANANANANASAVAAGLLADLAKAPLPTEQVSETEGHVAASYAVAPHRPPRANDKTVENPAVFINATVPLPPPPSSGGMKLGPAAPSVVSMKGAPTVPGGARLFEAMQAGQGEITEPGERARTQTRVVLACIAGVVAAALIAIIILAIAPARPQPNTTAAASATVSVSMTASSSIPTASPPPSTTTTATTTASISTATAPHATPAPPTNKPRPKGSSPTPPSSGSFAAPERSL